MPQMAPIWWSMMSLMFITTYIITMITMYYYNIYMLKMQKNNKKYIMNMNWTW